MANETDDTDPGVLRDRLLMQAERGEITGSQAEEAAAAHGLEPFERKPEPSLFDPKPKSHWSIVMAAAWIARRDFQLVREQDPDFCSLCFYWIARERKERPQKDVQTVKRMGYFLETRPTATVGRLGLLDAVSRVHGNFSSTAVMTIRKAEAALWRALSEGHLIAEGVGADGKVVEIPSREWAHLRLFKDGEREILRYQHSQTEPFTAVKLRQNDLLRLWPEAGESPGLLATVIDKGGRPAEYDWAAIKEIAHQQIRMFGKPHKDNKRMPSKAQLIEKIQDECADRYDLHPSTSQLKSYLNQWLAEMDGN